ncbi:MAG: type II toxin-antitoxin system RelE family toxin [Bryobacteraceae bacterium]
MKIELETQVVTFVRSLAPEPRKAVRRALLRLEHEGGNIRPLEGELQNYYRLRVLRYRIIFYYAVVGRKRTIRCVYAAPRNIIYEVFAQKIRDLLG